jgi:hypothetical protein
VNAANAIRRHSSRQTYLLLHSLTEAVDIGTIVAGQHRELDGIGRAGFQRKLHLNTRKYWKVSGSLSRKLNRNQRPIVDAHIHCARRTAAVVSADIDNGNGVLSVGCRGNSANIEA